MATISLRSAGGGETVEVRLERTAGSLGQAYHIVIADRRVEVAVESLADGAGRLWIRGRQVPFYLSTDGRRIAVWLRGQTYELEVSRGAALRAAGGLHGVMQRALTAPMPGTILQIHVRAGEAFQAHQALVVMESMKMEMTLSAPHAGRVSEVSCRVGQLVEMGATLARFEEPEDGITAE